MKLNLNICMMIGGLILFTGLWLSNIIETPETIVIHCWTIVFWGSFYIAAKKKDVLTRKQK